jgi:hypothetical protein
MYKISWTKPRSYYSPILAIIVGVSPKWTVLHWNSLINFLTEIVTMQGHTHDLLSRFQYSEPVVSAKCRPAVNAR